MMIKTWWKLGLGKEHGSLASVFASTQVWRRVLLSIRTDTNCHEGTMSLWFQCFGGMEAVGWTKRVIGSDMQLDRTATNKWKGMMWLQKVISSTGSGLLTVGKLTWLEKTVGEINRVEWKETTSIHIHSTGQDWLNIKSHVTSLQSLGCQVVTWRQS